MVSLHHQSPLSLVQSIQRRPVHLQLLSGQLVAANKHCISHGILQVLMADSLAAC